MPASTRLFAVIPAAGESRRMGEPKLLLPLGGKTVIARLIDALQHPDIAERFVVVRPDDEPLRDASEAVGATVIVPPSAPPDMRTSVSIALEKIERRYSPADNDAWLLVPADHPVLNRATIDTLIDRWKSTLGKILIPTFEGKRGHPTIFRWELAREVPAIPPDRGLDWLVKQHADNVDEFPLDDPAILYDLDTPADYERLKQEG